MSSTRVTKNFSLTSYTNNVFTTILSGPVDLISIVLSNTTASAVNVQLRIGGPDAIIVPTVSLQANTSYTLDLNGIAVTFGQTLQINSSAAGVHAVASGLM